MSTLHFENRSDEVFELDVERLERSEDLVAIVFHGNSYGFDNLCKLLKNHLPRKLCLQKLSFRSMALTRNCIDALFTLLELQKTCLYALSFRNVCIEDSPKVKHFHRLVSSAYLRRLTLDVTFLGRNQDDPRTRIFEALANNPRIQHLHLRNMEFVNDACYPVELPVCTYEQAAPCVLDDQIDGVCSSFSRLLTTTSANTIKLTDVSMICFDHLVLIASEFSSRSKNLSEGNRLYLRATKGELSDKSIALYIALLQNSQSCNHIVLQGLNFIEDACILGLFNYFKHTNTRELHQLEVIDCSFTVNSYTTLINGIVGKLWVSVLSLVDLEIVDIESRRRTHITDISLISPESLGSSRRLSDLRVSINGAKQGAYDFYRHVAYDMAFNPRVRIFHFNIVNFHQFSQHAFLSGNSKLQRFYVSGDCALPVLEALGAVRELVVAKSVMRKITMRSALNAFQCADVDRLVYMESPLELCSVVSENTLNDSGEDTLVFESMFTDESTLHHLCLIVKPITSLTREDIQRYIRSFQPCKKLKSVHFKPAPSCENNDGELFDIDEYVETVANLLESVYIITADESKCRYSKERFRQVLERKKALFYSKQCIESLQVQGAIDRVELVTPFRKRSIVDLMTIVGVGDRSTTLKRRHE